MSTSDYSDPDAPSLTDGATYVEVLMLGHLDESQRALAIGRAMVTPLMAAEADCDAMQRLRFYNVLVAFILGVAENQVGADGREAIVQCMRNVPASTALTAPARLQ